jgi:hypothetical protein
MIYGEVDDSRGRYKDAGTTPILKVGETLMSLQKELPSIKN